MNAFKSISAKVFTAAVVAGLAVGTAFAAADSTVIVTLPESVTLGSAILPAGQYLVTESQMAGGGWFVFRSAQGAVAAAVATKSAEPAIGQKTEVVLTNDGGTFHLNKLFIAGDSAGFQFPDSK